ncbi:MAG: hypothetical protein ACRDMX_04835 [Solirubrobacteraceae bacterium]
MRSATIGQLAAVALLIAGCGSSGDGAASRPRPSAPIDLSVYVSDARISVSPNSLGAGPVVFVVTNQSREAQALAIISRGGSTLATTAPINPQGTTHVTLDFAPGEYTIAAAARGRTEAQQSQASPIRSVRLRIGRARPSSDGQLLQP